MCPDSTLIPVHSLPLSRLWPILIGVACKYTGPNRLKVVKLLVRLVGLQTSEHAGTEDSDTTVVSKDRLDLTALKPLWQLYTTLNSTYGMSYKELYWQCMGTFLHVIKFRVFSSHP